MNKYIKCLLISLVIGIVFTIIYILVKFILLFFNTKSAVDNIIINTKYCGKERCPKITPTPIQPKNINITEWDKDIAKYAAEIVYRIEDAAYLNTLKINYPSELKVLKEIYNENDFPIFGSITESSKAIWICFRGTQTSLDITQDLKIQQQNYFNNNISSHQIELKIFGDNVKPLIHKGFMEIYMSLREEILDTLRKRHSNKPIIVSGHSLGAAISTIAGLDLARNNYSVVVYNYASPRIGDQVLSDLINNNVKVFRVVNTADVIPNLPLSVTPNFEDVDKPYNYTHCGILKTFTDNWLSILNNHLIPIYMKGLETF